METKTLDWQHDIAAIYRAHLQGLKPVQAIEAEPLDALIGISRQKQLFLQNIDTFLHGGAYNHVLLSGSRGSGKSSIVKATVQHYFNRGLRIIEFFQQDVAALPKVLDDIRTLPYHFILFFDDYAFEELDASFGYLKSALEGSIEPPPKNVCVVATSNRRHLTPEYQSDNQANSVREHELHYGEAVEARLSLADRFGLWISFFQATQDDYLKQVAYYFSGYDVDKEVLIVHAKRFALERGNRSGRTAKQFFNYFVQTLN